MPRLCEICGSTEADEADEPELTGSMEMLVVCEGCRKERQEPEEGP